MSDRAERHAEGFGPTLHGGQDRSRRRGRRVVRLLTMVLGATVLFAAGLFGTLAWLGGGVERIEVAGLTGSTDTPPEDGSSEPVLQEVSGVTNVLVVGSDSREGLSEEELLRLGTDDDGGPNLTDTLMLVQLDAENDRAQVLSFPRDLLVTRCDGTRGRINAAFQLGEDTDDTSGPECLVRTVRRLTGIGIDHYVQVDFQGFIRAVDAIGGVTFHIDEPMQDSYSGLDLEPGCVTFDGGKALGFVRARHIDSDFGRIARQQRFMRELLAEATSLETLTNPGKVTGLVRAVGSSLTTDAKLSSLDMAQLAYTFRELTNEGLETYTIPADDFDYNGAAVLKADEEEARDLFAHFRSGSVPTIAADPQSPAGQAGSGTGDPTPGLAGGAGVDGTVGAGDDATDAGPALSAGGSGEGQDLGDADEPAVEPSPEPTFAGAEISDVAC